LEIGVQEEGEFWSAFGAELGTGRRKELYDVREMINTGLNFLI
jgi:hypothetical protein